MPCLRIETTRGWLENTDALFDCIDAVLCNVLGVPPHDSLIRLNEYPGEHIRLPAKCGWRHVYIEVALFAGRSLETKRALYEGLTQAMADFGVVPADVTIALIEVPLENWGIDGGRPASDIDFAFAIAI